MGKQALSMEMGRRASEERLNKKLRADKLAESAGITPQALSNIECGKVDCKASTLKGLCTALGVSSDYILGIDKRKLSEDIPILLSKLNPDEILMVEQFIRSLTKTYHK